MAQAEYNVGIASRNVSIVTTEAGKLSEILTEVNKRLEEIDSSLQKLPPDTEYGRKSREKAQALKVAVGELEKSNKALQQDCLQLANGWRDYKEIVRQAREPSTIEETQEMLEQLKVLLKDSKGWQVDCVSFQENLNVTQKACQEAEDTCAEAAANEKDNQTTTRLIGGVATTVLTIGTGVAVGVATGGLAAPVILSAAAAKGTAGVLGVGTVAALGVTVALSISYGELAGKFRDSKNKFNQCHTQLSFLGSNIIVLQRATKELIDQLELGKKLHRDSLATKRALARSDAKLAQYMARFGSLE